MRAVALAMCWCCAAGASAQETAGSEAEMLEAPDARVPPPPTVASPRAELALPPSYDALHWEAIPGGPAGIQDPVPATHPDYDLILAGSLLAGIAYVMGASMSVFFGSLNSCWAGCRTELAALGLIPLGEWAAGFSGSPAAFISGGVFAPIEFIGLVMLIAGASAQHPELVSRTRRRRPAED